MHNETSLDIHGLTVQEAHIEIDYFLEYLSDSVYEVEIIHGYKNGHALLDFVRNVYKHPRIKRKILSLNNGITTFLIK